MTRNQTKSGKKQIKRTARFYEREENGGTQPAKISRSRAKQRSNKQPRRWWEFRGRRELSPEGGGTGE